MSSPRTGSGPSPVGDELAARRAEFARLLGEAQARLEKSPVGAYGRAPARLSVERLTRVAQDPWPHPQDVLAQLLRLRASLSDPSAPEPDADGTGGVVAYLGEGAYHCAAAHGALDVVNRVLVGFGTAYSDLTFAPDEVRVRAADGTVSRPAWVPARELGLSPDGAALYGALRERGHTAADAAQIAAMTFAPPANES